MDLSFIINHLGEERDRYFNAVAPPLIQSSNFRFNSVQAFREAVPRQMDEHMYTRGNNPTVNILRQKLAALEGTEDALLFSSGVAAISSAVISQLKAGDHALCVDKPYGWTHKLFNEWLPRYGVATSFVDGRNVKNIEAALQPNTRLIMLESPNSFTFELQDLQAIADIARRHNLVTVLDNTQCSSLGQKAAAMGIDLIVHTGSKYFGGHSDIVAGVVCGHKATLQQLFNDHYMVHGPVFSPHDAWLMLRSLRTLPMRLERINTSALRVVRYLKGHPKVERVNYPLDDDFPQYELALQQMTYGGGLLSIELKADNVADIERFVDNLKHFMLAVSWGGHESLVMPACALVNDVKDLHPKMPWNLVRLYTGLEEPDFLISDLEQAFNKL